MKAHRLTIVALTLTLIGCAPSELVTLPIYDTPSTYVRLEIDGSFGRSHSHPAELTTAQLAKVLRGIMIIEPLAKIPLIDDTSQPRRHPAFSEKETEALAPLLAIGLQRATAEEIVTFYKSTPPSGIRREVTSGGLFVQDDELHVILSNYRSPTHFMADPGSVDTTDDRLAPLRAIAPQRGQLDFDPKQARREPEVSLLERLFQWDRREIIVLLRQIPANFSRSTKNSE